MSVPPRSDRTKDCLYSQRCRVLYLCRPVILLTWHSIPQRVTLLFVLFIHMSWEDAVDLHITVCGMGHDHFVHFRYHVGSLAFGALILTLVQIARMILEYIDHKTRGKADLPSSCIHCLRYLRESVVCVYVCVCDGYLTCLGGVQRHRIHVHDSYFAAWSAASGVWRSSSSSSTGTLTSW